MTYFEQFRKIVPNDFRMESQTTRDMRNELVKGKEHTLGLRMLNIRINLLILSYRLHLISHIEEIILMNNVRIPRGKDRILNNWEQLQADLTRVLEHVTVSERASYLRNVMEEIGAICLVDGFQSENQINGQDDPFQILDGYRIGWRASNPLLVPMLPSIICRYGSKMKANWPKSCT